MALKSVRDAFNEVAKNQESVSSTYAEWSTIGILGEVLSTRNIHNARLSENLKVSEMIVNEQWRWPNSWREQFPMLVNLNVPKLNPQKQDITMWRCANGSLNEFSSRIAWEHISQNYEKVKWCNVVWFSQCNPRMAFVLWMAVKRRLQTQDRIDNGIKEVITKIHSVDQPSTDHVAVITNLKRKLETLWPHEPLEKSQKVLNKNLTKYPKILSKFADPDILEAYRKVEFDSHTVNQIIISSLFHQGLFDIADVFIKESQEPDVNSLRSEIEWFNKVISAFKAGNEVPAMTWISENRETLTQNRSSLDFEVCALHHIKILRNLKRKRDFGFPENHMEMLRSPHPQYLGYIGVFYKELKRSNTSHLLSQVKHEELVEEMTNQFFSIIGKKALSVTIEAGARALPTLLKLARVMSLNKMQEWETMKKLPVPIDLGSEFQYHSVFVCPVSGEENTEPL
ncbi:protein RMD5 [Artemisia annua]|uniref:Protein RMD5 n=1 Tax=Artemisia annua TaxID=35608 RepID=A0A2U1L7S4_ARTAN|nr:protein RMD5 [Artemisia annua]